MFKHTVAVLLLTGCFACKQPPQAPESPAFRYESPQGERVTIELPPGFVRTSPSETNAQYRLTDEYDWVADWMFVARKDSISVILFGLDESPTQNYEKEWSFLSSLYGWTVSKEKKRNIRWIRADGWANSPFEIKQSRNSFFLRKARIGFDLLYFDTPADQKEMERIRKQVLRRIRIETPPADPIR